MYAYHLQRGNSTYATNHLIYPKVRVRVGGCISVSVSVSVRISIRLSVRFRVQDRVNV